MEAILCIAQGESAAGLLHSIHFRLGEDERKAARKAVAWLESAGVAKDRLSDLSFMLDWETPDRPTGFETAESCADRVRYEGLSLGFVLDEFMSTELCMAAVKQDGRTLGLVPRQLLTAEICLAAAMQHHRALAYVPAELMTGELCLAAVRWTAWPLSSFRPR